ncbi:MAG TPA: hypothetical protein VNL98_03410 [Gemmatimonadales bacterium]|nr:hypothetical protein [Gemmatimonadales bacterium]
MRRTAVPRAAAIAGALSLLGCTDALAPRHLDLSFDLVSVDGRPVPRLVQVVPPCLVTVGGGSLELNPDGSFALEVGRYQECDFSTGLGGIAYRIRYRYLGAHNLRGDVLTLTVIPVRDPTYNLVTLYSGDSIVVELSPRMNLEVGAVNLTYRLRR